MSNRFYFSPSDSGSDLSATGLDDDNDTSSLPFPKPLDRSSFLSADFTPTAFLSSLTSRFQTLEDLHAELRDLSATLTTELVDLVNDNYSDFLTLGQTLSGGAEKVEDVRMGLLSFQRDVQGVRDLVVRRREEVAALVGEKKRLRTEIARGRALLEVDERVQGLERKLGLGLKTDGEQTKGDTQAEGDGGATEGQQWSDGWLDEPAIEDSEDDRYDGDETLGVVLSPRLKRRTEEFLILKHLMGTFGPQHPFIAAQDSRVHKIQDTILSDIDVAIRQEPEVKTKQRLLQLRATVAD